jgi:hypothetical protein
MLMEGVMLGWYNEIDLKVTVVVVGMGDHGW